MKSKINITRTMLEKSICDCNAETRQMLKATGIVDYDKIDAGEKVTLLATFKNPDTGESQEVKVSCYRANTRGDKRIWINGIKQLASAGDVMVLSVRAGKLSIALKGAAMVAALLLAA